MGKCIRAVVNKDLCVGHGQCEALAPSLFRLEQGLAQPVTDEIAEDQMPQLKLAMKRCPEGAISAEDLDKV